MQKTLLVIRNEIAATLRRKLFLIFAFGIPLVVAVVLLIVTLTNRTSEAGRGESADLTPPDQQSQGLVDPAGLVVVLPEDVPSDWLTAFDNQAAAHDALAAGEISGYYVVPAGYVEDGEVSYVLPEYNPTSNDVSTARIEWVLLYNLLEGDADLAASVWNPLEASERRLATPDSADLAGSWVGEMFPSFMALTLYVVIIIPAGLLVTSLTDEKKNRVMEVLVSSVSPYELIGGKIVALGLLGLLQTAIWVGVLWAVMSLGGRRLNIPPGYQVPLDLLAWSFVFFLLGFAMYGAQMAAVGALAPDVKDTRSVTVLVLSPLIIVYMLLSGIVARPDGPLALVLSLFPLTGPVGMVARMAVSDVPLWQPALAAALQLGTSVLIVRTVARFFRAQILLSGQPLSPRRFIQAVIGRA
jgi:ABC-2 type transport system permease protein